MTGPVWGGASPAPGRDAAHITSELHTLLGNAGIPGPYVLAGHSFGGLYTQLYAARYAEQVAGVVLVESSHPAVHRLPDGQQNYEQGPAAVHHCPGPGMAGRGAAVRSQRTATGPAGRAARADRGVGLLDPTHRHHSRGVPGRAGHHGAGGRGPRPGQPAAGRGQRRRARAPTGSPCRTNSPLCRPTAATAWSTARPTPPSSTTPVTPG